MPVYESDIAALRTAKDMPGGLWGFGRRATTESIRQFRKYPELKRKRDAAIKAPRATALRGSLACKTSLT